MRALIDTCVIIDVLQDRQPFCREAQNIFLCAANNLFTGCITAKSCTDIYYLSHRNTHSDKTSREILTKLFALFEVLDTAGMDCRRAIPSPIADFEDAVMAETAARAEADCIITRNLEDFKKSNIPALSPAQFLERLEKENG